ncbi:nitroreductase family deazaflavin-dependent oxidoreductase [Salinibacterium sp. NG22]|uniref:nitroreductase family deazaflavin-dependent oxidoreductase n=1 Tax=Salinibacterium sp. NG22 TaxID=2792040 RepID=UPI0018CC7D6C|nr:nitroreductase family deazaflavin-dependent oxidoreductase [Salinibacterium sp. NG22]MBH0110317.1 nitroreductase family deazaflavin-dependent oxidoreductase [Salinibacterium sp. NG22]
MTRSLLARAFRLRRRAIARAFRSRRLMRAPIGLYRAGLGFVFGRRLMMLEHTGRNSGESRYVVLEVVTSPNPNELVIASALGRRAQWVQNLGAESNCHVSIGLRRRVPAIAEVLEPADARAYLAAYEVQHPRIWKELSALMTSLHDGNPDFEIPLVRITLRS